MKKWIGLIISQPTLLYNIVQITISGYLTGFAAGAAGASAAGFSTDNNSIVNINVENGLISGLGCCAP